MADKKATYTPMPHVPPELRGRYEAVVGVLSGTTTVSEAARRVGLSRNHFQTGDAPEPGGDDRGATTESGGRRRPAMPAREQELLEDNERLRRGESPQLSERTEDDEDPTLGSGQWPAPGGECRRAESDATSEESQSDEADSRRTTWTATWSEGRDTCARSD